MDETYRAPRLYALCTKAPLKHFKRGEIVITTDDDTGMNFVVSGYLKRYMISDRGSLGIQIIYGPQDVFPLTKVFPALLGQSLYCSRETYYYEAMCDTTIANVSSQELSRAATADPLIYRELLSEAGQHLKTCVHSLENTTYESLYKRMAHQLAFLAREYGRTLPNGEGVKILVPLTHQELADILGSTRESATRAIVSLRQAGLINTGKGIAVPSIEKLSDAAYI